MAPVPVAASLEDMYTPDTLATQRPRWHRLLAQFEARYGRPAEFVARSPGRVNIIGEHIDYSLYPVLPMAIAADVLLAVAVGAGTVPDEVDGTGCRIEMANVQEARFAPHAFDVPHGAVVDIDATVHAWSNYFKSGLRGALELLRKRHGDDFRPRSMRVLVDGNVPAGGGLSSSAAFTSASALAAMVANGEQTIDKTELTELAIVSERAVGVNSGGMDQSASVLSERGSALFVSFTPSLSARPVHFPKTYPELAFVIAQSFVQADKFVTGPIHYNLRVVECSLAAAYLNAVANPPGTELAPDAGPLGISLHGFHAAWLAHSPAGRAVAQLGVPAQLEQLVALVAATLTREDGYTRGDMAAALGTTVEALDARFTARFPVRAERFRLRQRALHVFTEALRVLRFMALLEGDEAQGEDGRGGGGGGGGGGGQERTAAFNARLGALMNETQDSCREAYECSCPEIDRLCAIARRAGAYGSRLTGAGWGGCSVHLVPVDSVAAVKEAWEREYYGPMDLTEEQRDAAVVVSLPGSGSAVYRVKEGVLPQ